MYYRLDQYDKEAFSRQIIQREIFDKPFTLNSMPLMEFRMVGLTVNKLIIYFLPLTLKPASYNAQDV